MDLSIMLDEYAREGNEEMIEKIRKEINDRIINSVDTESSITDFIVYD